MGVASESYFKLQSEHFIDHFNFIMFYSWLKLKFGRKKRTTEMKK